MKMANAEVISANGRANRGGVVLACVTTVVGGLLLTEITLRLMPSLFPPAASRYLPTAEVFDHQIRNRWEPVALIYDDELAFLPAPNRRFRYRRTWDLVRAGDVAAVRVSPDPAVIEFKTDPEGFRNPPGLTQTEIAVVGDSFVQSVLIPYEETWTSVLARKSGREVHNLGVAGYGPQQILQVIERFVLRRKPKVVVLSVFEGNDVHDAELYQHYRKSNLRWDRFKQQLERADRDSQSWRRIELSRVFASLRFVGARISGHRRITAVENCFNPICKTSVNTPDAVPCVAFGSVLLYRETITPRRWKAREGWRVTTDILRSARDLVHGIGAHLVVVLVPSKGGVYLPLLEGAYSEPAFELFVEAAARKYGDTAGDETWRQRFQRNSGSLNRLLREWLSKESIPYIDLRPDLRTAAGEGRQVYFPFDSHWNPPGNQLVGELVAEHLTRLDL